MFAKLVDQWQHDTIHYACIQDSFAQLIVFLTFLSHVLAEPLHACRVADGKAIRGSLPEDAYFSVASECMRKTYAIVREHLKASFNKAKMRHNARVKSACISEGTSFRKTASV